MSSLKWLWLVLLAHAFLQHRSSGAPIHPLHYKYGYYKEDQPTSTAQLFKMVDFTTRTQDSIKTFQKYAALKETGIFDTNTITKMSSLRCGVQDIQYNANNVLFSSTRKWNKLNLTYSIANYTDDMSKASVDRVIRDAFNQWEQVTSLTFRQINRLDANIVIYFVDGMHWDGAKFDGPGRILAHAFPPPNGGIHFDDAETFTDGVPNGVNLLWTAIHESGHALGLRHSSVQGAIMNSMYPDYKGKSQLAPDDVTRIQALYGSPGSVLSPTTSPKTFNTQPTSKACKDNINSKLCNGWKSSGSCKSNQNVRNGCAKTCLNCV